MRVHFRNPDDIVPELQMRASRGFVKDIHDPALSVREPLGSYQTMLDLIRRDNDLATAFDIITDFSTYRGFDFILGNKGQRDRARNKFTDLNWFPIDRNLKQASLAYGDAFLEYRDTENSGTVDELHPLETTEMRIKHDIHGKVTGYVQRPFNLSGLSTEKILDKEASQGVEFSPETVTHFRTKWIGSQVYSYTPMEAASTAISSKLFASNYLMNIFITMPPRYLAHLAGASEKMRKTLKNDWYNARTNYKRNVLFSSSSDANSKVSIQKIDPLYDEQLLKVLNYLRREVLKQTRVPQSWLEESASENRGITEMQMQPFNIKVQSFQQDPYEIQINREMLPRLGFKTKGTNATDMIRYKYNAISMKLEKEILDNAAQLRNMGLKNDALSRYLDGRGILGTDPNDFEIEQNEVPEGAMPSRKREDKATDDMKNKLDTDGVSAAGEKKAKEVAMRSSQFNQYPYVIG